jgi:hypothetical protein
MSDLDDLEDIAEQQKSGYNDPSCGWSKRAQIAFKRSQARGARKNRSEEKRQMRALDRRRALPDVENQS